jgi:phosphate-selective porin
MARRLAAIAVFTILGLLSFPLSAGAHVSTAGTSLTVKKAPGPPVDRGDKVIVFGKLKSGDATCRTGKTVTLFRKKPGRDRNMGTDLTDAEGEYRFKLRPRRTMKLYTRFNGTVTTSYGHSHTCQASQSKTIRARVG